MKDKILRTKAWKFFIIVFCIPQILSHILLNGYMENLAADTSGFDPDTLILRLSIVMIISMVCAIPMYLWMWAVGNELPRYIPQNLRVQPGFFNIALVSSFLLSSFASFSLVLAVKKVMNQVLEAIGPDLDDFDPSLFDPSEFLSMLSAFKMPLLLLLVGFVLLLYCYYFSAKTISKAKLQDKPGFGDNFINFILHFVFFGSVFYFQPEIKKVMDNYRDEDDINGITDIDDLI